MTEDEADQLIDLIAQSQTVSVLDRAAWHKVLAGLDLAEATEWAIEVKTTKPYVNPDDLNAEAHPPHWAEAWMEVLGSWASLGAGGDYGHPAVNRAVMMVRRELRYESEERAKWAFKAAYEGATSPIPTPAVPELEGGVVLPMIGRRVER
jgi:hypothetical protein